MKNLILTSCLLMCILGGCSSGQVQQFSSPSGRTTITVKYDLVSRPTVYEERGLFDRELWSYTGSGFMETVYFQPEWISETEFIFRYDHPDDKYDEEFIISTGD